jgi:hypothetical protein
MEGVAWTCSATSLGAHASERGMEWREWDGARRRREKGGVGGGGGGGGGGEGRRGPGAIEARE